MQKPKTNRKTKFKGDLRWPIISPRAEALALAPDAGSALARRNEHLSQEFSRKMGLLAQHYGVDLSLPKDDFLFQMTFRLCSDLVPGFHVRAKAPQKGRARKDYSALVDFVEKRLATGSKLKAACKEFLAGMPDAGKPDVRTLENAYHRLKRQAKPLLGIDTQNLIHAWVATHADQPAGLGFYRQLPLETV